MTDDALDKTFDSGSDKQSGELAAGGHLGKYKLERVLGSGGMGVVWCAHDPDLERKVAIKVLRRADAGPALRTRLLREARAMARLKHPNVLTVYEVGSDGDRDFIAMELVDGTSLDQWIAARPPFDEVWAAILAAGRGLAAAHAAGLVHRDFKPHNVLRSRDGRVLVTDFGLARGAGEEAGAPVAIDPKQLALEQTVTPRQSDNVLDSTLTQPGQLIGTPAYMAPEQYDGAAPDPRTDQFAYCVTAWQALTGDRPFDGRTIDELRRAARGGVAGVRAKLPRGVRAVLARGLSADPEERWPDLEALLGALERDKRRRVIRGAIIWSVCGSIAIFAAIAGIQLALHHPAPPAPPPVSANGCVSPDEAFSEAWSPARRATLEKRLGSSPSFTLAAEALDGERTEWQKAYEAACAAKSTPATMSRMACLLGERDELATFSRLLDTVPASSFERIDLWGALPRVEACLGDSPVSPPLVPEDRRLRDRIVALRARVTALRFGSPFELDEHADELRRAARAIGWKPLEAEVEHALGVGAQVQGDWPRARDSFARATEIAQDQHDYKLEATSRIAVLEIELNQSAQPGERGRFERLVEQARAAVQRAGNDPALAAAIDQIVAGVDFDHRRFDAAIPAFESTRTRFLQLRAVRQAALAASDEATALAARGHAGDLDHAWQVATDTAKQIESMRHASVRGYLPIATADLAWRRGDLADAHAREDKVFQVVPAAGTTTVGGRVIAAGGAPAAGATVIAWQGELAGDATRVYRSPRFTSAIATADANGAFTIEVPPHGALIAELGTMRSLPAAAGKSVTLSLLATRKITGTLRADSGDIDVGVRYDVGESTWLDTAAPASGGAFEIAGIPATGGRVVATRDGHTISAGVPRDGVTLAWPAGSTVDIIVRGAKAGAVIYVLRGHRDVRDRAQLGSLAASEADASVLPAGPIGPSSETEMGAHQYQPGDLHAVARETAPGEITACAVLADARVASCARGAVPAGGELALTIVPK